MSNSYFQFKQFTIHQERCAMKVSTDACIQGAWTPIPDAAKRILDIGTGTGLLSLMLAQRASSIYLDALEIDEKAAGQSRENVKASSWAKQIRVIHTDARNYIPDDHYDLIVCNPPFFIKSLLGENTSRNIARHDLSLSLEDLLCILQRTISPSGYASVLLPVKESDIWQKMVEKKGWYNTGSLAIVPRQGQSPNRVVNLCAPSAIVGHPSASLIIRDTVNEYTEDFKCLLQPYYLKP